MARKPLPLLSRALTVLRSALGWDQAELAKAAGVRSSVISDYERDSRNLPRTKLEELARTLGLPVSSVDWALSLIRSLDAIVQAPGHGDAFGEAQRQQVEAIAAETGRLTAEFTRSLLNHMTAQSRALAARQRAPSLWGVLKRRKTAERRVLVEEALDFRSWALCELLCAESERAAADDAGQAVELAELAVLLAELLPGEEAWRWRVRGYAGAHLGNALRVQGNLAKSDEVFGRALELWAAGASGDPGLLPEAQTLSLEASLRTVQSRLREATELLDRALAANPGALRTSLLIKKARVQEWSGEYEAALSTLRQVGPLPPGRQEPRVVCMLKFNPAWNLAHLGRFAEAEALLPEIRVLTAGLDNELDSLRLRWLEGRVSAGLGRRGEALAALSQVRSGFAARGIAYDAALATLELAALHLEEGRTGEVKTLARQMAPIFQAQGVHREALAALRLFCRAAEREAATAELARRIVKYLYRAQHDPGVSFEAEE